MNNPITQITQYTHLAKAARLDDALLNDIHARRDLPGFRVWWLGQSSYLLQYKNQHLLIDPYLSDALTDKYALTDRPHTRMTEQVIRPARLDFIDVVTASHNHSDHMDAHTLQPLFQANPNIKMLIPAANREFAGQRLERSSSWFYSINAGEEITLGPFTFHGIPAAHEMLTLNKQREHLFLGYVI